MSFQVPHGDGDDSSFTRELAATRIQAIARGKQSRKNTNPHWTAERNGRDPGGNVSRHDDDRDLNRGDSANKSTKLGGVSGGVALPEMNSGREAFMGASETLTGNATAQETGGGGRGGGGGGGGGVQIDRNTAELFASLVDERIMVIGLALSSGNQSK